MRIGVVGGIVVAAFAAMAGLVAAEDSPAPVTGAPAAVSSGAVATPGVSVLPGAASQDASKDLETLPIDSGFVILDGKYLARPYVLRQKGEQITLNGRPLPTENLEGLWMGRGGWRFGPDGYDPRAWRTPPDALTPPGSSSPSGSPDSPGGRGFSGRLDPPGPSPPSPSPPGPTPPGPPPPSPSPPGPIPSGPTPPGWPARSERPDSPWSQPRRSMLARIERHLSSGAMLLGFRDGPIGFVTSGREMMVLEALFADLPKSEQVRHLTATDVSWMSSAQWKVLVDTFEPDPELRTAFEALRAKTPARIETPESHFAKSQSVAYATTVCALALVVFGMGTLMNHLPRRGVAWREPDVTGEDVPMLVRNVGLVIVLGTFDLVCTLLARKTSGFWELNPLGDHVIDNPAALVGFKFASLILGAVILLLLRRYRGAQTASWWLCLLCTILALRWATYSSMFWS